MMMLAHRLTFKAIMNTYYFSFCVILFASLNCVQSFNASDTLEKNVCESLRKKFSETLVEYERCVVKNAVPVGICNACVQFYVTNVQVFHNLTMVIDPHSVRERCSDHYMNQDVLNIVWKIYQSSRDIWTNAACSNCFVEKCDADKIANGNITSICTANSQIITFKNSTDNFNACLEQTDRKQGDVCNDCIKSYNLLEISYKNLPGSPDRICFEAVDQFNRTNKLWYVERKCPKPNVHIPTKLVVVIPLGGLFLLCALGYGGFYFLTKYRQRATYMQQFNTDSESAIPPIQS